MSRQHPWTLALVALGLAACSRSETPPPPDYGGKRPVILISIDSLRADHTTPYGYRPQFAPQEDTMPWLQQMAQEGVVFERTSSVSSWTLPSHMSLLTGMHPIEHGIRSRKWSLNPEVELLAGPFQAAGYKTAGFFSAPFLHPVWGFSRGFDIYMPGPDYLGTMEAAEALAANRKSEEVDVIHSTSHTDNRTAEQVMDHALTWLEQDDHYREPFFLFLHLWDPHYDYFPPQEYRDLFLPPGEGQVVGDELMQLERELSPQELQELMALYDAEIRYTDDQLARLWSQLEEWGIEDAIILAVTSDHGDEFLEHGERGHHLTLYEEVLHVPMVVRAPKLAPAGQRVQATVSNLDLAPTLLDLAGLPAWPERTGRPLTPLWTGEEMADRQVPMDLVRPALKVELRGYRHGDLKTIFDSFGRNLEVFDLSLDPKEQNPRNTELHNKADAAAVEALEFFLRHRGTPFRPGKVKESRAMTSLLSELGYTED